MEPATRSSIQPLGPPLGGTRGDWRHRILRFHVPLALASAAVIFLWMSFPLFQAAGHQGQPQSVGPTPSHQGSPQAHSQAPSHQGPPQPHGQAPSHEGSPPAGGATSPTHQSGDQTRSPEEIQNRLFVARFTTATGYVGLGLLGLTLLIGPANLALRRRTPVSSYLARDVGMWAAIVSVVHVIAGFFVHGPLAPFGERILYYFFAPDGSPLTNAFGWGNWTGLAATVIVVGLLAISSDFALGKLKARRWKNIQRINYALFALVIAHAIFYGALLRITSISTLLLGLIVIAVFIGQAAGVRLWRRRHSRRAARLA